MNIEFRCLEPGESGEYRKIRLESLKKFPDFFSADYEESVKIDKLSIERDIENKTSDKFIYGAFFNNQLIGIGVLVKNSMNVGNIYQMYIKPKFQGHNIGMKLLENIIIEAEKRFGKIELSLEVQSHNYKAKELYFKAGFRQVLERKETHCIVMAYKFV